MALRLDDVVARIGSLKVDADQRTAWIALSGAPGSGKSTLLDRLREMGHVTRPECARQIIERELELGKSLRALSQDPAYLVEQIFNANWAVASQQPRPHQVIFDRSLPDVLAFGLVDGVDIEPYIAKAATFRFKIAFIFEQLRETSDHTLYHDENQRLAIEDACTRIYKALGAQIVYVPLMSVDPSASLRRRLEFIERTLC